MVSGTLAIKVLNIQGLQHAHASEEGHHFAIRIKLGGHEQRTKFKGSEEAIEQTIHFEVKDTPADEEVVLDIIHEGRQKKPVTTMKMKLEQFTQEHAVIAHEITFKNGAKTNLESSWVGKHSVPKTNGHNVPVVSPQQSLIVHETHRPWYFRASYYYDTTKHVYEYATGFRVISSVARFGESTANTVLEKVLGKNLTELDRALVAPTLHTLDDKVDAAISTVLVRLIQGQNYVLETKNNVVESATTVAKKSTDKISSVVTTTSTTITGVVGSTLETAVKAKDYTTEQIKNVSTSAYGTVISAKDYTTSQVANVSSSAYGTVKNVTVSVASYVPILGPKIRA